MGLAASVLRLIVRQHRERPWTGPAVTLGVQDVHATYDELARYFKDEQARLRAVPPAQRLLSTSHYFRQTGRTGAGFVHARVLFQMLGVDGYDDLDFADFEKPTLIHDLNQPVPDAWRGRYGLVLDGGTIEHVFDMRTVLGNIASMLSVGGDVLHVSPLSGWVNHGFYQINPCLLYDFYGANGFDMGGSYLIHLPRNPTTHKESIVPFEYTENAFDLLDGAYRTLFFFRARKRIEQPLIVPTQGFYRQFVNNGRIAG